MTNEVLDKPANQIAAYSEFYSQLSTLENDNSKIVFNYESPKGNKEARSHVNTLRLTKGALERTRKEIKEESLRTGKAIDSEAALLKERIEAMISVHTAPLEAIDQREKDRVAALAARVSVFDNFCDMIELRTSSEIAVAITELEAIPVDDSFQEFIAEAAAKKDARLIHWREVFGFKKNAELEKAELDRLRIEAEARAQQDRDNAIAEAAANKAKADAENAAKAEREASERRELQLKFAAEQSERLRLEAAQKAIDDAKKAAEQAEKSKLAAIAAEQARVAKAAKDDEDERVKREKNIAHARAINRAALEDMIAGGLNEECAKQCIKLIASGKVSNIKINY